MNFKNFKINQVKRRQFQNFQKIRRWFIEKSPEPNTWLLVLMYPKHPNMWLLVNHTKPTNTLYWNWYLLTTGNYKSAGGQLQNSGQLQNNSVNGAMVITMNRVIKHIIILNNTYFFIRNSFIRNYRLELPKS